jgi:hypothetical protein
MGNRLETRFERYVGVIAGALAHSDRAQPCR